MTLGHIEKTFQKAIENNSNFVAIAIKNGIKHDPRISISCTTNFKSDLSYYMKFYKDNENKDEAELRRNANTKITGVEYGNNPVVLLKKLGVM